MLRSNACVPRNWNLPSVCFLTLIAGAVVLTPSQAVARNAGAIIGGIAGIAAAAIIANEIARTQRPVRVVEYRNRAPQAAVAQGGFIFTGNKAINARNEKEFVLLNEKLPIAELKKRFSRYKIVATAGEDCEICVTISGRDGSFEVYYDENGLVITGILSSDKRSYDALGNAVGSSLRNAIGTQTARCDAGMWTSCASPRLDNLSYIVDESDRCPLSVKDDAETKLPACARIAGFAIQK